MSEKIILIICIFAAAFLNACAEENASIETAPYPIEKVRIETSKVNVEEEPAENPKVAEEPMLEILSPKDLEVIEDNSVVVKLNAKNFNIVLPNSPVKKGEGHFYVWLDSEEKKGPNSEFAFRDVSSGRHSITAELRNSDHSPLSPRVLKTISVNVRNAKPEEISKFKVPVVEADDFGFYPATLSVRRGLDAELNLSVRKENVYFNGLEFDSEHFSTEKILPGHSQIVQFKASKDFKITSYWPSTKAKKAELKVVVR